MRRIDPKAAAGTMLAVLGAYGTALLLAHLTHQHAQLMVLAVVLTLTLDRTQRGTDRAHRVRTLVVLPLVAIAASGVGHLLISHPDAGDALFVAAIGGSIYLRRFGPAAARAGTLVALPFIALLTTPAVGGGDPTLWAPVIALIALAWTNLKRSRPPLGLGDENPGRARHSAPRTAPANLKRARPPLGLASTRMAVQMALALAVAFALGRALFPTHWSWVVLTAFIVCSGNRGRGDVVHKSGLRLVGALGGTAAATAVAGHIRAGSPATVVAIFVVLGVAVLLRTLSYAYWAAGITAVLALLNGYFGVTGALGERLVGILLGAAIGVAVSWLVLPVRTSDVLRRRLADALAALSDVLAGHDGAAHRFDGAVDALEQIAPPLRTIRRAQAIEAMHACLAPARTIAAAAHERRARARRRLGQLARDVGALRRANAGRPFEYDERAAWPEPDDAFDHALLELDAALQALRQK
ncbi:FUSC family protein [Solirubrobacter soli]|uniref:FUSC family protein n=1 Tax=Solirubrobacter soli TaxID=363832 RepID=UPI0012FCCE8A|nr:FUSC family protein [Solirubrobacter soli]